MGRARALRDYLAEPVGPEHALADLREGLGTREERFLTTIGQLLDDQPDSPYVALLRAADCSYGDVVSELEAHGLEHTLATLRDAGVHITADEWKGVAPIVRDGLELPVTCEDFDRPATHALAQHSSSGSSGAPRRTTSVAKEGLTAGACDFALLLDACGATHAPTAVWLPGAPGSGFAVVLAFAKLGNPPERWFTPTKPIGGRVDRIAGRVMHLAGPLLLGVRLPRGEHVELDAGEKVAAWLGSRSGPRVLEGFTSSVVRAVRSAVEQGIDLTGVVALVGGEAVDEPRVQFLERAGVRVAATYGATEIGIAGLSCLADGAVNDYHVCLHRMAAIPADDRTDEPPRLLFTGLSPYTLKTVLNVDVGDVGLLERRPCGCQLGELGLDLHLTAIRSHHAKTTEGMTVPIEQLLEAIRGLLPPGATRDDYQVWDVRDEAGLSRLVVAVSPRFDVDTGALTTQLLDRLGAETETGRMAADVWRQAGTLEVISAPPRLSAGGKLPPVVTVER